MGVPSAGSTIVVVPDDEPSPAPTNASSMKWVSGGNSAAVTSGLVDASRTIVGSVVTVMVASASSVRLLGAAEYNRQDVIALSGQMTATQ